MSISYSGITSHGKVHLPSVESWGQSMNIMKDPPRSIHTRRKDKVGMTAFINEEIDASHDRAAEAIRVYARGSNPAVSVMYGNMGNSGREGGGGGYGTNSQHLSGRAGNMGTSAQNANAISMVGATQASLPYKIMKDGAFRPPVRTQAQLLPLSRQPRAPTRFEGRPDFPDWTKKLEVCGDATDYRQVKNVMQTYDIAVPKTIKKVQGMQEPYEIKYSIKQNLAAEAFTNKTDRRHKSENNTIVSTGRYIQTCLDVGGADTAHRDPTKYKAGVENNLQNLSKNIPNFSVDATHRDPTKYKAGVQNNLQNLSKNIPNFAWEGAKAPAQLFTPRSATVQLKPTTNRGSGGYMSGAGKPLIH
jgi:hypothetical protein